jgi:FkbM family methyltransferase
MLNPKLKEGIEKVIGHQNTEALVTLKHKLGFPHKEPQYKIDFYSQFFSKGDLVFDVGANMGSRVRTFLQIGAKVIAVEPQAPCVKQLQREFGRSITKGDLIIVQKGCGAKEEVKDFYICETAHVKSSFSEKYINRNKDGRYSMYDWQQKESIELTTLDKLIEQYGVPKFIKIDVEGYEPEVLRGLTKKVPCLSFEYLVPELRDNLNTCMDMISTICPKAYYNYSIGESFVLDGKWVDKETFLKMANAKDFDTKDCGDVYVRS